MRFVSPVAAVVFLLILGLVVPASAKGGKGKGGGGHGGNSGSLKASGGGHENTSKHEKTSKDTKEKGGSSQPANDKTVKDKPAKDKTAKDKSAKERTEESAEGEDEGAGEGQDAKGRQLANFQRQRDKKIAQAEHLRQIAERNGNTYLAANADRLEAQAHEQYAQKLAHLEKFGVTDPDDGGLANPQLPPETPLDVPLGTWRGLLPWGR